MQLRVVILALGIMTALLGAAMIPCLLLDVADARAEGFKIIPLCPFAKATLQKQTEWHDVVVWRGLAERAQEYLKKGTLVYLEGKLTHRKWQDKDGNPRKTTEVVANYFRMLSSRGTGSGSNYLPSEEPAQTMSAPPPRDTAPASAPSAPAPDDEDLPF